MGLNGLESCGNRVDDVTRGCQVSGRRDVNINQWNVKTHWVCRNRDIERHSVGRITPRILLEEAF